MTFFNFNIKITVVIFLKNKTFFKFKPARDTARAIVGYVGDGQQYFGQIRKWYTNIQVLRLY